MRVDERFKKGLRLFNAGKFFECHEVIENLWLETPKDDEYRDLYKGVIQAAAAIYQAERGILSGALGLYRSSVGYLKRYEPRSLGLNVSGLVEGLHNFFQSTDLSVGDARRGAPTRPQRQNARGRVGLPSGRTRRGKFARLDFKCKNE